MKLAFQSWDTAYNYTEKKQDCMLFLQIEQSTVNSYSGHFSLRKRPREEKARFDIEVSMWFESDLSNAFKARSFLTQSPVMLRLDIFKKIGGKGILYIKNQEVAGCPGQRDKRDFIFFKVCTPCKLKTNLPGVDTEFLQQFHQYLTAITCLISAWFGVLMYLDEEIPMHCIAEPYGSGTITKPSSGICT